MNAMLDPPLDVFGCGLRGVRLIEASAGTGKTWAICGLYLRLLLRPDQPLTVQQILVVTFTKAATAELRDRIRGRIAEVLAALEQPGVAASGGDPFVRQLLDSLEGDRDDAARKLVQALRTFDEAAIFTIHGFCQRALDDTPFTAGLPLRQELVEDDSELCGQVARDFWRRHVAGAALPPGLAAWLAHCKDSPERLAALVKRHSAKPLSPSLWPDPVAATVGIEAVQRAYDALRPVWLQGRDQILRCVRDSWDSLGRNVYRTPDAVALAAQEWDAAFGPGQALDSVRLGGKAALLSSRRYKARKGAPACKEHPFFEPAGEYLDLWDRFTGQLEAMRLALLRRVVEQGPPALLALKRQRRVVAFDDMLSNLRDRLVATGGGALAAQLRARYPAALIDEFQDTDPLQFEIFDSIYGARTDTALFMVGDPKQAIYSFRNADLHTYLKARDRAGERYTLAANQRSSQGLIDALNAVFTRNPQAFMLDGLRYQPVRLGDKPRKAFADPSGPPRGALHLWQLPVDEGGLAPVKADAATAAARACAAEISRLLQASHAGALRAADIAVLVRSHAEGRRMRAELALLGIGSVELAQASVFDSADAQELDDVLRAVLAPARHGLLRTALASGLLGLTATELLALDGDEAELLARAGRMAAYKAVWLRRGIGPMLRELAAGEGIEARLLARPDGERRLTNLRHLAECLHEASREQASPEALLRWLQRQRRESRAGDATQLRLESDRNLVQIVTIHKSKGLEYPVVFCPFLWDGHPGGGRGAGLGCEYHDRDGRHVIDYRDKDKEVEARIRAEKDEERLRLVYVALTRAVHRCYLVVGLYRSRASSERPASEAILNPLNWLVAGAGIEAGQWRSSKIGADDVLQAWLALARQQPGCILSQPLPTAAGVALAPEAIDPARLQALEAPAALPRSWRLGSYSGLVKGAEHDRSAVDHDGLAARREAGRLAREQLPDDDILKFPSGAREGSCLHAAFEHADFAEPQTWPAAIEAALRRHPPARGQARPAPYAAMVEGMMRDVLHTPLGQGFTLSQVPRARIRAELSFNLASPRLETPRLDALLRRYGYGGPELPWQVLEGYLHGAIDLVYEHGGRYWILDWKSNHLGWERRDYEPAALRQAMDDNGYHLQLLLYTVAVHRWLQRRLPGYDYERHFGGVHYLFVRGVRPGWSVGEQPLGVHFDRPALELVRALEAMLGQARGANQ